MRILSALLLLYAALCKACSWFFVGLEKRKMSSSSAEVANSTSTSSGNEAKNHGNVPVGNEIKSTEKIQGEKRSHDNSGN